MVTATKQFTWAMAHMLDGHEGLCKNLHGHNYKMEVTAVYDVEGYKGGVIPDGPAKGMVVDFKFLKNEVQDELVEKLDHATMINSKSTDPFEKELAHLLNKHHKKIFYVPYRPTAENMATSFLKILQASPILIALGIKVTKIRLYETDTSYAEAY